MLIFLASVLEQMDLASEHVAKGDVHNARFGLMLTDNAIELVLHRVATNLAARLKAYRHLEAAYPYKAALEEALGVQFEPKLRFARTNGVVKDEQAQTIAILHGYRNEVYHVGIQHEAILPSLALLYFDTVCRVLEAWDPGSLSWSSNQQLPERAKKYFKGEVSFFPGGREDFASGCHKLAERCASDPAATIAALADHADHVISDMDLCLDIVANGIYDNQRVTRDEAIRNIQAWPLALTEKGRSYAAAHGWTGTNTIQLSDWLAEHYPVRFQRDPIPSFEKRASGFRSSQTAHLALANYHSFMRATRDIREALSETAAQIEAEIDYLVDAARER